MDIVPCIELGIHCIWVNREKIKKDYQGYQVNELKSIPLIILNDTVRVLQISLL